MEGHKVYLFPEPGQGLFILGLVQPIFFRSQKPDLLLYRLLIDLNLGGHFLLLGCFLHFFPLCLADGQDEVFFLHGMDAGDVGVILERIVPQLDGRHVLQVFFFRSVPLLPAPFPE